ncbi:hypothetical protein R6Q59_013224 [Mikania micrantha]
MLRGFGPELAHEIHHQFIQKLTLDKDNRDKEENDEDYVVNNEMVTPVVIPDMKNKFTTSYQGFESTLRTQNDTSEVYSRNLILELSDRQDYLIYTRFQPAIGFTCDFWRSITSGWFESNHIDCWINKLMLDRPQDAVWTILPSYFLSSMLLSKTWLESLGSGETWPFPSIVNIDMFYIPFNLSNQHWCFACIDIPRWTMTVYDIVPDVCSTSRNEMLNYLDNMFPQWLLYNDYDMGSTYRPPPFERVYPINVPRQIGTIGDCGVWFCILLQRLTNGKQLYMPDEDTTKTAIDFRWSFAKLMYENKIREESL